MWFFFPLLVFLFQKGKADDWDDMNKIFINVSTSDLQAVKDVANFSLTELELVCNFSNLLKSANPLKCSELGAELLSELRDTKNIYNFNVWYLSYLLSIPQSEWTNDVLIKKHIDSYAVLPEVSAVTVNTDNLLMYYQYYKSTSRHPGTPIVLLPGWGDVKESFFDIAPFLADKRDVVTVDLRGAGQTGVGPTPGNYTAEQMATDVADLVTKVFGFGVKPVILGATLGGKISLESALDYGSFYSGVVIADSTAGGSLLVPGPLRESFITLYYSGEYKYYWDSVAEAIFTSSFATNDRAQWIFLFLTGSIYNRPQAGIERQFNIGEHYSLANSVEEITLPAFIMHGTEDQITVFESAILLKEAMGWGSILYPMYHLGHTAWHMDPNLFLAGLESWLEYFIDY